MMAVRINPEEVPKAEMRIFCLALADAAERFFKNPDNEAAFQLWLKNKTQCAEE